MPPRSLAAALAAAALMPFAAVSCGPGEPARAGSPCGAVDLSPSELGLVQARAVTLCLLNAERTRRGLAPLREEGRLELAAQRHSEDMVRRRFFEHDNPDGADPQARMLAAGYASDNAFTGENIAWATGDRATPAAIADLWMHSPPHRDHILRPGFVEVGVGVAPGAPATPHSDDPPFTYTTDFGGPPQR